MGKVFFKTEDEAITNAFEIIKLMQKEKVINEQFAIEIEDK